MQPQFIVFYSIFCPHSKSFVQQMAKSKYRDVFKKFLIDPNPQTGRRPRLPKFLKEVPTILVTEQNPNTKKFEYKIYTGKYAFMWLNGTKPSNMSEKKSTKIVDSTGLETFNFESNGLSDQFSFLYNDEAQEKNFVFVGSESDTRIVTPDETGKQYPKPNTNFIATQNDITGQKQKPKNLPKINFAVPMPHIQSGGRSDVDMNFERLRQEREQEMQRNRPRMF